MAETALITIANVRTYRLVDSKFDTTKFAAFVQEVQRKNLRGLLGDALYYAFMNDARATGIYADLLNGKPYKYNNETIQYYGLIPALVYWWLAIAAREGDMFQTTIGAAQFVNNQQQSFETSKEKERIASNYMETAQDYANDVIKFLNENSTDYPLWETDSETNTVNFVTFKI